jgi:hypothetical protein
MLALRSHLEQALLSMERANQVIAVTAVPRPHKLSKAMRKRCFNIETASYVSPSLMPFQAIWTALYLSWLLWALLL